jgi:cation transport ATPase
VVTLPEMLVFYALVPAILRGARDLVRARAPGALMLLLITLSLTLGYALGEANAGAAYRHRAQVLVFLLLFGAAGLDARRVAHTPEQPVPEPA